MVDHLKKEVIGKSIRLLPVIIALIGGMLFFANMASAATPSVFTDDNWVHSQKPYDYKNGLLDDPDFLKMINHNLPQSVIDNDLSTQTPQSGTYTLTSDMPFDLSSVYVNGTGRLGSIYMRVVLSDGTTLSYKSRDGIYYQDVDAKNIIQIDFIYGADGGTNRLYQVEIFGSYKKVLYPSVDVLSVAANTNSIDVKFKKPDGAQAVDVWINNKKIARTDKDTYTYTDLSPDTDYDLMFINWYGDNNYGRAVKKKVRTKKEQPKDISALKVKQSHDRVDLSWQLPNNSNFAHVNIYRDEVTGGLLKNFFGAIDPIPVAYADNHGTKIFETNGTYFNDLTVAPQTKYKYVLTTSTTEGQESPGVSTTVTTSPTPPPVMGDNGVNLDSNGDYVIEWDSPITGSIKVKIDGQDYTTLPAANKKVIIPHADMVLDWMGHPKVQLIPIADDGTTGQATTPPVNAGPGASGGNGGSGGGTGGGNTIQTIGLPFGVDALVTSSFDLIYILGPFVLLGLALMFVPRLIKVIRKSIAERQNNKPVRF